MRELRGHGADHRYMAWS